MVPLESSNLEGAIGVDFPVKNQYLVAKDDHINMYDSKNFSSIGEIPIKLQESKHREKNQIIAMQASEDG